MRKYVLLIGLLVVASFTSAQNLKVCIDKKGRCGYANEEGEVVVKCRYELAFAFENGLGKVGKNGKYGFVTPDGEEILPVSYDEITPWGDALYRIKNGSNYGLFSKEDGIIVKPKYSCISQLNCYGKALITTGGKNSEGRITNTKVGIIEADGSIAIEPKYDKIGEFQSFNSYSTADIAQTVLPSQLMHIGKMSKAEISVMNALVSGAQKGGMTNVSAPKVGIHPNDTLFTAAEYVCCYKGKKSAVVNKRGTEITPFMANCQYTLPAFDMCAFRIGTTKVTIGYWDMNKKKKLIIGKNLKVKKRQVYATPFTGDVALVTDINLKDKTNSVYFINRKGEKVSENYITASHKGGYWVTMNQQSAGQVAWGVLDGNGKTVLEPGEYIKILPHNSGDKFTLLDATNRYGVIDKEKNVVIPFEYSQLGEPVNGWYWATREGTKTGIIDEKGEVVVPFEFHNLFMNTDKECTNIWVRKEPDGYWSNYDVAKKQIVGEEVVSSSNFADGYAWVVPKGQSFAFTGVHRTLCNRYNVEYTAANTMLGVLIDKEGNTKTSEPIPLGLFPAMKKALEANGGTLKPVQERQIIFKDIRNSLVIGLGQTVSEEYWDF